MKNKSVLRNYEKAAKNVIEAFLLKHEYDDDGKVIEYTLIENDFSVIEFADYYVSLSDMIYDIANDVEQSKFFEWYDYCLDKALNGYNYVNYRSYLKGYRVKERGLLMQTIRNIKNNIARIYWKLKFNLYTKHSKSWKDMCNSLSEFK